MQKTEITPEILQAIRDWYTNENLTYKKIADLVGLKSPSISQWFNGQSNSVRMKTWKNLYPHIKPYLPKDYIDGIHDTYNKMKTTCHQQEELQISQMDHLLLYLIESWRDLTSEAKGKIITIVDEDKKKATDSKVG